MGLCTWWKELTAGPESIAEQRRSYKNVTVISAEFARDLSSLESDGVFRIERASTGETFYIVRGDRYEQMCAKLGEKLTLAKEVPS
jgi:hypothetical protein